MVDDSQIPDGGAFRRPHRLVDCLGEAFRPTIAKRQQANQFGVDALGNALSDGAKTAAVVVPDDLHVVVIVAFLAIDGDANAGALVRDHPAIRSAETSVSPFHTRQSPVSSCLTKNSEPRLSATL